MSAADTDPSAACAAAVSDPVEGVRRRLREVQISLSQLTYLPAAHVSLHGVQGLIDELSRLWVHQMPAETPPPPRREVKDANDALDAVAVMVRELNRLDEAKDAEDEADVEDEDAPPPDGTVEGNRIWLRGERYRLTPGLRRLLGFLLLNPGCDEEAVVRHCGYSDLGHLHKRLNDLRNKLRTALKGSGWALHVRSDERKILLSWVTSRLQTSYKD